ncbi:CBU_0592 family membrane protein [Sulfurimonas sp.]
MKDFHYYDFIGILGVMIIVITYLLLQVEKIQSNSLSYSLLNILGSLLITYSLIYSWNLSSFVIEFFWILISLYGVWKYFKNKKATLDLE